MRNFNYVVVGDTGDAFVIDPYDAKLLSPLLQRPGITPKAIINTHEHDDHTAGNDVLRKHFGFPVYAHPNAKGRIPHVDRFLKNGESLAIDESHQFSVIDTPGHTAAHLCLLLSKGQKPIAVFTGDTLFNAGVGNCHSSGGDARALYETIEKRFAPLPDDILVYPGHDYLENNLRFTLHLEPDNRTAQEMLKEYTNQKNGFLVTNMKKEREINLFLRLDQKNVVDNLPKRPITKKQVFLTLRQLRDGW